MQYPQQFWNDRYGQGEFVYGILPNEFFKTRLDAIPTPGKLLLLAEGEGRNAVYAAEKGWQVTAVDFSEKGREKALALAAFRGVQVDYHVGDVREFGIESLGPWDCIGLIFSHFPPEFRSEIHQKCLSALRPKGSIILELFTPEQMAYSSGGPKDVALLYTAELARTDFAGAASIYVEEAIIHLQEGPGHTGLGAVVRGVAVR